MDIIYHEYDAHGSGINRDRLQKLFNIAIRFVYNLKYDEHITPYIAKSGLLTLSERRESHILSMAYKIINGLAPQYLSILLTKNTRNERSKNKLIIKKVKNEIHRKSFQISAPKIWNRLDDETKNKNNIKSFNIHIKQHYSKEK